MGNRAQIDSLLESISELALKVGLLMLGLATAYLLWVLFGGKLTPAGKVDQAALAHMVGIAKLVLMIGSVLVVAACCVTFFSDESIGLIMTIIGGALHFFAPAGIDAITPAEIHSNPLYPSILKQFSSVGLVCFVPGCLLLLRAIVLQFARVVTSQSLRLASEQNSRPAKKQPKFAANCWNMAQCNEHAKRMCPAWAKRRSCWQIKSGCLCDQDVIRRAAAERDRALGTDTSQGAKTSTMPRNVLTMEQKKERCRACTIYSEHQRMKFRIASPLAMISVIAVYAFYYGRISQWVYDILMKTDSVMKILTLKHGAESSFAAQGHTVTTLAMICLGVVLVSVTLKLLEYLIYELQV